MGELAEFLMESGALEGAGDVAELVLVAELVRDLDVENAAPSEDVIGC